MELSEFSQQIDRLKGQWPNAYSDERIKLLWQNLRGYESVILSNIVDYLITNSRQVPLLADILEASNKIRENVDKPRLKSIREIALEKSGIDGILGRLPSGRANPFYVLKCKRILFEYRTGKLSKQQFLEACDELELEAHITEQQNGFHCPGCNNLGYIIANHDGYDSLWRCHCRIGLAREGSIEDRNRDGARNQISIPVHPITQT